MEHLRKLAVGMLLILALTGATSGASWAGCYICWPDGECWYNEGSCVDFNPDGPYDATCEECELKPANAHLLVQNGLAWVVDGAKKTPVTPDALPAFMAKLRSKYPKATWKDPKTVAKADAEVAAFLKDPRNRAVSRARLDRIAKKTGMKIQATATK